MKQNFIKVLANVLAIIFTFSSCTKDERLDEIPSIPVTNQEQALTDSTTASSINKPIPEVVVNIWASLLIEGESVADSTLRVTIKEVSINTGNELISPDISETLIEPTETEATWSSLKGLSFPKVQLCEPVHFPSQVFDIVITITYVVRICDSQLPLGQVLFQDQLRRDLHYSSIFQGGPIDVEFVIDLRSIKFFVTVDDFN